LKGGLECIPSPLECTHLCSESLTRARPCRPLPPAVYGLFLGLLHTDRNQSGAAQKDAAHQHTLRGKSNHAELLTLGVDRLVGSLDLSQLLRGLGRGEPGSAAPGLE